MRSEKYRSGVMTSAIFQSFCRKYRFNICSFDGTRINPRNFTPRNTSMFIHNNLFCLIWKSNRISFDQVTEHELKPNFKLVDNIISDKHVESFFKNEYNP